MLNDFNCSCPVYIDCGHMDLRRGIDGLASMVSTQFRMDPFQTALFLFCGRKRDRIKALYWEGDGFLLLYKRLENEKNTTSNAEMVTISRVEYEAQQERIAQLEQHVSVLMEALRLSRHKQFGVSSEKSSEDDMEQLSLLFNEAEFYFDFAKAKEESVTVVAAHKRHKKHEYALDNLPENIPVEVTEHRLDKEELTCPACGNTMVEIGKEVHRRLKIVPAQVVVFGGLVLYICLPGMQQGKHRNSDCKSRKIS